MAVEARITSKGQITLPIRVRKELGVRPGDKIAFERNEEDELTIRPVRPENPFAKYRGIDRRGKGATLKEIIAEVRKTRDGTD